MMSNTNQSSNNQRLQTVRIHEYFIEQITQAIKNTIIYYYEKKFIENKEEKEVKNV